MSFQLTYSQVGESHAAALKRKEARLVDASSATLTIEDEKGHDVDIAVITEGKDGHHEIAPLGKMMVTVNGEQLQQKRRIMSGDAIKAGQLLIHYYAVMPPARPSMLHVSI